MSRDLIMTVTSENPSDLHHCPLVHTEEITGRVHLVIDC